MFDSFTGNESKLKSECGAPGVLLSTCSFFPSGILMYLLGSGAGQSGQSR